MGTRAYCEDSKLLTLLKGHPLVRVEPGKLTGPVLEFGDPKRFIEVGNPTILSGLTEMVDNNPLVCSECFSVPDAFSTLALIALGPLIRAGAIVEPPVCLFNQLPPDGAADIIESFLGGVAGTDAPFEVVVGFESLDLGNVLAVNAMAMISPFDQDSEIDDLFDEAYGRSFFVRRDETSVWDTQLVAGLPHATYRLRLSDGEPHKLLTIQVLADRDGKCGTAQVVHAMNIMCGFEETLGCSSI